MNRKKDKKHPALFDNSGELTDVQRQAAEMMCSGEYLQIQVAEKIGVHRNTLSRWLTLPKIKQYMDEVKSEHRQQGLSMINSAVPVATEQLIKLLNDKDKRVQLEAIKLVLDRALGKPTGKIEIETEVKNTLEINIEDEIKRIMSGDTAIPQDAIEVDFTEVE